MCSCVLRGTVFNQSSVRLHTNQSLTQSPLPGLNSSSFSSIPFATGRWNSYANVHVLKLCYYVWFYYFFRTKSVTVALILVDMNSFWASVLTVWRNLDLRNIYNYGTSMQVWYKSISGGLFFHEMMLSLWYNTIFGILPMKSEFLL